MRDGHGQSVLEHQQLGQVVAHGAAKFGDDAVAAEPDGGAHHDDESQQQSRESAAVKRLAFVQSRREDEPGESARAQGQHQSARQGGNRPGREHGGDEFPHSLAVAGGAGVGEGEGGEGRELEETRRCGWD